MPADVLPTVAECLTRLRLKLDEPLDTATNFWTDAELLEYLNEGCREVWQKARETHEQWFVRTMRSTDGPFTVNGHSYDPAQLALADGGRALPLPADFAQLLYLEPLPDSDGNDTGITFEFAAMTGVTHRALGRTPGPTTGGSYVYDIEWRSEGPMLLIAPEVNLDSTADIELRYVRGVAPLTSDDTFEGTCFNRLCIDAALAYAEFEAHRKEKETKNIAVAQGRWSEKLDLVGRSAGPRTSDAECVDGFLEDWLD